MGCYKMAPAVRTTCKSYQQRSGSTALHDIPNKLRNIVQHPHPHSRDLGKTWSVQEKCIEYNIPLDIAFVDYKKTFDSVQTQAVLTSLKEQDIEDVYIEHLKEINTNTSMTVHIHKESNKTNIRRGVRQGETISAKLFTASPESMFRLLTREPRNLKIDGEYLSHLRFADDILICVRHHKNYNKCYRNLLMKVTIKI